MKKTSKIWPIYWVDLLDSLWLSESELQAAVDTEYNESIKLTTQKRAIFDRRDKLNLGIKDQQEKLYVRLVYSIEDTLLALEHSDERTVNFYWRNPSQQDYADVINNDAKFDYEQMDCEKKKYQVRWDKLHYWVGIEAFVWYDYTLHAPKYNVISPKVRCPDWFGDVNNGMRYTGFEMQATRYELENDDTFFNVDKLQSPQQMTELEIANNNIRSERALSSFTGNSNNDILNIYYHYRYINGRPYLTVRGNNRSVLIKFEEIPAMTNIETKDPSKIQIPVVVRHYRPLRWDPFGISIPDLMEDKESVIQLIMNLSAIKAQHEALGDMFLFDPDKIDVNNISIPSVWPKYVPVTWLGAMQGGQVPMMEVPKGNIKSDSMNMPNLIRQEGMLGIGMDNQTLGIQSDRNITATENQRVQGNANLRLMLGVKWDNYAEKAFWLFWYKFNLYFFDEHKEKTFALNDSIGRVFYSVKKKDFGGITDIDIEIKSKNDVDAMREKDKIGFMAISNIILSNPATTPAQKAYALKEMCRLNNIPEEKVYMMIGTTPDEEQAMLDVELLNRDEELGEITDMNQDHRTYIDIYKRAYNTKAKHKAIAQRQRALAMVGQQVQEQPAQQDKAMSNMLINDMMQQSNKKENQATSLQTIK